MLVSSYEQGVVWWPRSNENLTLYEDKEEAKTKFVFLEGLQS